MLLESLFHEQFFHTEMKVSLTNLFNVRRYHGKLIDDYLARFRVMKNKCFTPISKVEMVKIVINGLDYNNL